MASKLRIGTVQVDHFADWRGRFDRVYVGGTQVYPIPAPTIASVTPAEGWMGGGEVITITGTNFYGTVSVSIGGAMATSVVVLSETLLTAVTGAATAGSTTVRVTTPSGPSNALPFVYADLMPGGSYVSATDVRTSSTTEYEPIPLTLVGTGAPPDGAVLMLPPGSYTADLSFASASYWWSDQKFAVRLSGGDVSIGSLGSSSRAQTKQVTFTLESAGPVSFVAARDGNSARTLEAGAFSAVITRA